MAIGYLRTKTFTRSKDANAVAASAYASCSRLRDESTGTIYDYRNKGRNRDFIAMDLILPDGTFISREQLWNKAEAAENRKNSVVARELTGALPNELDAEAQKRICLAIAKEISERHSAAVDICIHREDGNNHAHIKFTTRRWRDGELAEKTRELDDRKDGSAHLLFLRKAWERVCNQELEAAGFSARIDMRSYEEQGVEKEGQLHLGNRAFHHHQRTGANRKAQENEAILARNEERKWEQVDGAIACLEERHAAVKERFESKDQSESIDPSQCSDLIMYSLASFLDGELSDAKLAAHLEKMSDARIIPDMSFRDAHGNGLLHYYAAAKRKLENEQSNELAEFEKNLKRLMLNSGATSNGINNLFKSDINGSSQTPALISRRGFTIRPQKRTFPIFKKVKTKERRAKVKGIFASSAITPTRSESPNPLIFLPEPQAKALPPIISESGFNPLNLEKRRTSGPVSNDTSNGKLLITDDLSPEERAKRIAINKGRDAASSEYARKFTPD